MYVDLEQYYKYQRNMNIKGNDKPYLLEHCFDLDKKDYVVNSKQCCYYTPVDITDYLFISEDENILRVNSDSVTGVNNGSTMLNVYKNGDIIYSLKVIVYQGNRLSVKKSIKDTLWIKYKYSIFFEDMMKHIHCTHYNDCIFKNDIQVNVDDELSEVNEKIFIIKKTIVDFNNIIDNFLNGDIIYHGAFEDYYNIRIRSDGSFKVSVPDNFGGIVKNEIKVLRLELRDYNRLKYRLEKSFIK